MIGVWRSDIAIDNIEFTKGACPPFAPTTIAPTTLKMVTSTPTIPLHLLSESKTLIIYPITHRSLVNLSTQASMCEIPSFVRFNDYSTNFELDMKCSQVQQICHITINVITALPPTYPQKLTSQSCFTFLKLR